MPRYAFISGSAAAIAGLALSSAAAAHPACPGDDHRIVEKQTTMPAPELTRTSSWVAVGDDPVNRF